MSNLKGGFYTSGNTFGLDTKRFLNPSSFPTRKVLKPLIFQFPPYSSLKLGKIRA